MARLVLGRATPSRMALVTFAPTILMMVVLQYHRARFISWRSSESIRTIPRSQLLEISRLQGWEVAVTSNQSLESDGAYTPLVEDRSGKKHLPRVRTHKVNGPKCLSFAINAKGSDLSVWGAIAQKHIQLRVTSNRHFSEPHSADGAHSKATLPVCFNRKQLEVVNSEGVPGSLNYLDVKDPYTAGIRRMHFDDPQLLTVLPPTDCAWRYRRCAVVGNSGGLLRERRGAEIDAHDAVFRINYAPTEGFESYVGARTTFDVVNMQHAKAFVPEVHGGGSLPQARRSAGRDSKLVLFEIENQFAREKLYAHLQQHVAESLHGELVILNPELVAHAHGVWYQLHDVLSARHARGEARHGDLPQAKKPMSGWYTAFLAMQVCGSVSLYGMSPYQRPNQTASAGQAWPADLTAASYHYFDDVPGVTKSHSFDLAFDVYRHLGRSPCTGVNLTTIV